MMLMKTKCFSYYVTTNNEQTFFTNTDNCYFIWNIFDAASNCIKGNKISKYVVSFFLHSTLALVTSSSIDNKLPVNTHTHLYILGAMTSWLFDFNVTKPEKNILIKV